MNNEIQIDPQEYNGDESEYDALVADFLDLATTAEATGEVDRSEVESAAADMLAWTGLFGNSPTKAEAVETVSKYLDMSKSVARDWADEVRAEAQTRCVEFLSLQRVEPEHDKKDPERDFIVEIRVDGKIETRRLSQEMMTSKEKMVSILFGICGKKLEFDDWTYTINSLMDSVEMEDRTENESGVENTVADNILNALKQFESTRDEEEFIEDPQTVLIRQDDPDVLEGEILVGQKAIDNHCNSVQEEVDKRKLLAVLEEVLVDGDVIESVGNRFSHSYRFDMESLVERRGYVDVLVEDADAE
jgi:hypothetical protein